MIFQTHDIEYDSQCRQPHYSAYEASEYTKGFFAFQNQNYVSELAAWANLNTPIDQEMAFVFVVCRGEAARVPELISIYDNMLAKQSEVKTSVAYILNASQEQQEDAEFQIQSDILRKARDSRPWMHVIEKRFPNSQACLGRARKYGLDYCLLLSQRSNFADPMIISNEADMIEANDRYLLNYKRAFEDTGPGLVQGSVAYPEYCAQSESLDLFLNAREAVHHGQGLHYRDFPGFLGILPVGRNFAVSSSVAAAANSIDPVRRKETDDDMNFGADIFFLGGSSLKRYINNPIVTSPRREIEIVASILSGDVAGTQNAYENFHGSFKIYRKGENQLSEAVSDLREAEVRLPSMNSVLNSYYSWLFRSRMIEKLPKNLNMKIDADYSKHKIGYWHRERQYFEAYKTGYDIQKLEADREAKDWLVRLLKERRITGVNVRDLSYVE